MREFTRRLVGRRHPLCGDSTFSAGRIRAGTSFNVVPDHCELIFDRRFLPTERLEDVDAELDEVLGIARERFPGLEVEAVPEVVAGSLDTPEDAGVVRALIAACEAVTGRAAIAGAALRVGRGLAGSRRHPQCAVRARRHSRRAQPGRMGADRGGRPGVRGLLRRLAPLRRRSGELTRELALPAQGPTPRRIAAAAAIEADASLAGALPRLR